MRSYHQPNSTIQVTFDNQIIEISLQSLITNPSQYITPYLVKLREKNITEAEYTSLGNLLSEIKKYLNYAEQCIQQPTVEVIPSKDAKHIFSAQKIYGNTLVSMQMNFDTTRYQNTIRQYNSLKNQLDQLQQNTALVYVLNEELNAKIVTQEEEIQQLRNQIETLNAEKLALTKKISLEKEYSQAVENLFKQTKDELDNTKNALDNTNRQLSQVEVQNKQKMNAVSVTNTPGTTFNPIDRRNKTKKSRAQKRKYDESEYKHDNSSESESSEIEKCVSEKTSQRKRAK